jgi:hypothetical protein
MIAFAADGRTIELIAPVDHRWALFCAFGLLEFDPDPEFPEYWDSHVDWLASRFASPDEWLGPEGDYLRARPVGVEFMTRWRWFKRRRGADTSAAIAALLTRLVAVHEDAA